MEKQHGIEYSGPKWIDKQHASIEHQLLLYIYIFLNLGKCGGKSIVLSIPCWNG